MTIGYGNITGSNGEPFWTITTSSLDGEEVYKHQGDSNTTQKLWISFTNIGTAETNPVLMISGSGFGVLPVLSGAVSGGVGWTPVTHNGFVLLSGQSLYARVEAASEENKTLLWGDINAVTQSL